MHKDARQIEDPRHPAGHRQNMKGFDPQHSALPDPVGLHDTKKHAEKLKDSDKYFRY
jgi:hypothetical protein